MSYIICAEIFYDNKFKKEEINNVIKNYKEIRTLKDDEWNGIYTLDMSGDFDKQIELTRFFCNALLNEGIYEFKITHSY